MKIALFFLFAFFFSVQATRKYPIEATETGKLIVACTHGYFADVQSLLGQGLVRADARDNEPISIAAEYGHLPIVKLLVFFGADPSANQNAPLFSAVLHGNLNVVRFLLSLDVVHNTLSHADLRWLIQTALSEKQLVISRILEEIAAKRLVKACEIGDLQAAQDLVGKTFSRSAPSQKPWHVTKSLNDLALESLLGPSPIISAFDDAPIIEAALHGHETLVDFLLARGASATARENSPLVYAAAQGHLSIVMKLVLQYHADPAAQKCRALTEALEYGHADVARFLLSIPSVWNCVRNYPARNVFPVSPFLDVPHRPMTPVL